MDSGMVKVRDGRFIPAPRTSWNGEESWPRVAAGSYVSPRACVTGRVTVGEGVFIGPQASVRGDEGQPLYIGDHSNVQDGVILHGLKGQTVEGSDGEMYSIYVGREVSLAHGAIVHGPAFLGDGSFVGFRSIVLRARLGEGVFVGHGAMVIGVEVPAGRAVPDGSAVTTQEEADRLPPRSEAQAEFAREVVEVNRELVRGYLGLEAGGD